MQIMKKLRETYWPLNRDFQFQESCNVGWVTLHSVYVFVAGEQEVNILAEILDNSADVFEDLAKEIGSEDIVGKYNGSCF